MKNSIKLNGVDLPREKMVSLDEDRLQSLDFTVYGEPTFVILGYSDEHFLCKVSCSGELIEKVEDDSRLSMKLLSKNPIRHWRRHVVAFRL